MCPARCGAIAPPGPASERGCGGGWPAGPAPSPVPSPACQCDPGGQLPWSMAADREVEPRRPLPPPIVPSAAASPPLPALTLSSPHQTTQPSLFPALPQRDRGSPRPLPGAALRLPGPRVARVGQSRVRHAPSPHHPAHTASVDSTERGGGVPGGWGPGGGLTPTPRRRRASKPAAGIRCPTPTAVCPLAVAPRGTAVTHTEVAVPLAVLAAMTRRGDHGPTGSTQYWY